MTTRCEQEDSRQKGVDADQAGIGYRTISKEQTVYRWTKFKNSYRQSSVQEQKC